MADPSSPVAHGLLDVGHGQQVYWEEWGDPEGVPAVYLHGGPGATLANNAYYQRFDLTRIDELGHLLGVSSAESWNAKISSGQFTGPDSVAVYGGTIPVTGDNGHWVDGTMSQLPGSGIAQEAAMDPSIFVGSRKLLTTLDWAGLSDIGWEVDPSLMQVPEPTITLPAIAGLALLARRRRA